MWRSQFLLPIFTVCILLVSSFAFVESTENAIEGNNSDSQTFRLPQTLIPNHYDLTIFTRVDDFMFNGKVIITVTCIKETNILKLHMKNLTINYDAVTVTCKSLDNATSSGGLKAKSHEYDEKLEIVTFSFEKPFAGKQEYTVELQFGGVLNTDLKGFYRSSYTVKETNTTKWLAVTQLEPNYARWAFPCFDEPEMKATFSIHIGHPTSLTAISNMPLETSAPVPDKPDMVLDSFQKTVKMTTFLVAYFISDFTYKETKGPDTSVQFRTWTYKSKIKEIDLSAEEGPKYLAFYEKYFNNKFALPKMDMVAVPDLFWGAMENYGLVTYRESVLFFNKDHTSVFDEYHTVNYIAHEMAHQWFGNLVTMKWWSELWLKEAFSVYMATIGLSNRYKSNGSDADTWTVLREDMLNNFILLLPDDCVSSTHPVSTKITEPSEINQIFDTITYNKGACLIHMISTLLTEEVFQKGINSYLEKYSYMNSDQVDLWNCLSEAGHQAKILPEDFNVKTFMDSWTLNPGFPILEIKRDYGSANNTIHITQKRFLTDAPNNGSESWWIPLTFVGPTSAPLFNSSATPIWLPPDSEGSANGSQPKDLIVNKQYDMNCGLKDTDWILVNREMSVVMRINYDEKNWDLIIAQLKADHTKIPVMNRAQVILDVAEFAKYKIISYTKAFDLMSYITKERDSIPWRAYLTVLYQLGDLLLRTDKYEDFKTRVGKLIVEEYKRVSTQEKVDNFGARFHKQRITHGACYFNVPELESEVKAQYTAWKQSPDTYLLDPDYVYITFCENIRSGKKEDWEFLYNRYSTTESIVEKDNILTALACTKDPALLSQYLNVTFAADSKIRKQDNVFAYFAVLENPVGYKLAKDYLFNNAEMIYNFYGQDDRHVANFVSHLAAYVTNEEEMKEMNEFIAKFNDKYMKDGALMIEDAKAAMRVAVQWHKDNYKEVSEWCSKY